MSRKWSRGFKTTALTRRRRGNRPAMESLESRRLLSTVDWISSTSGSWDTASNWSNDAVPGAGDDVTIDVPGVTVTIGSNVESVNSVTIDDPLNIAGGGLSASATSTISGGLTMTAGTLTVSGAGASLTVTGATTVSGANVYAEAGATINLSGLTSFTSDGVSTLEAIGTGSVLNLPNLTTVTEGSNNWGAKVQLEALAGATLNLPDLRTISTGTVFLEGDGSGSALDLPDLTGFAEVSGFGDSTLQVSDGATADIGLLSSLSNVNLDVVGTGEDLALGGITSFGAGNVTVSGGSSLSLPGVTSYSSDGVPTLEATGTGSALAFPNLTTITEGSDNWGAMVQLEALAGGTLSLPALPTISTGTVFLEGDGTGSALDLPDLTGFAEVSGFASSTL
jgi:fibronectin-binding autotransporter adhesin